MAEQAKKRVERVLVMLDEDELGTLDSWRFEHRMPSRSAAIRELLRKALEGALHLEIATYTSERMELVRPGAGRPEGARLRALTCLSPEGEMLQCVSEEAGEVDPELWKRHLEFVAQARASRVETLHALAEILGRLRG